MQKEGIKQQISFQIFILYNQFLHSPRKRLFIKFESIYRAAC